MTKSVLCLTCENDAVLEAHLTALEGEVCPECGCSWTKENKQSTIVEVTMPDSITGGVG